MGRFIAAITQCSKYAGIEAGSWGTKLIRAALDLAGLLFPRPEGECLGATISAPGEVSEQLKTLPC